MYGDRYPDEFAYSDGVVYYAAKANGTLYEVVTAADSGGLFPKDATLNWLFRLGGLGFSVFGDLTLYRGSDNEIERP